MTLRLAGTSPAKGPKLRYIPTDGREAYDVDFSGIERRCHARHRLLGTVSGMLEGDGVSTHRRLVLLDLKDISRGGIGAHMSEPLELGSPIQVLIPSRGFDKPIDLRGKVVRCLRCENGYDIGIESFTAMTAA